MPKNPVPVETTEPQQQDITKTHKLIQYLLTLDKNNIGKKQISNKGVISRSQNSALYSEVSLTSKCTMLTCNFLVDTGAPGVYISGPLSRRLYGDQFPPPGVERSLCQVANSQEVELLIGNETILTVQERSLSVRPLVLEDLSFDGILGYNALHALGFLIDPINHCLKPGTEEPLLTSLPATQSGLSVTVIQSSDMGVLSADATVEIPGRSAKFVPCLLKGDSQVNDLVLIEQSAKGTLPPGLLVPCGTASVVNSRTHVFLLNATTAPVTVHRHSKVAATSRLDHCPIMQLCAMSPGGSSQKLTRENFLAKFPETATLDQLQKRKLQNFLWSERAVFSQDDYDIGCMPNIEHVIDTGDERPYKETLRRHNPKTREQLKSLVDEMLAQGIIRESFSPWSSAPVLVRKKSGGLRFAVDYRGLNAKTVPDSYPLPVISDALDSLSGAKFFSTLDLTQGFWQIPLSKDSIPKTAFNVPQGHYEFLRLPFGLINAPATFQRAMQSCLSGLNWEIALCFLDDIIVFSNSFEQHLERLKAVFKRLVEFNLKLKPAKCEFMKDEVKYLGHVVSGKGISTDPAKIEAIQAWETPRTPTQVRSFLGLAQYYRRFVKGFSQIAAPLHEAIIHGSKKIKWGKEQEEAFRKLKDVLSNPPVMAHPDFNKPFIIDVDASDVGIGAVLSQLYDDSKERVVAYQSYKFKPAERKWSTTEREFFALVTSCRLFKSYIYGRRFTIRTDHQALLGIISKPKDLSPKWARWWSAMSGKNCKVIYRPGKNHGNADGLSRTSQFEDVSIDFAKEHDPDEHVNAVIPTPMEPALIKDIQLACPIVSQLIRCIRMNFPSKNLPQYLDDSDPYHAAFIRRSGRFSIKSGVLQYDNLTVVPRTALPSLLGTLHDSPLSGHLGRNKTLRVIQERFWWPSLSDDVRRYVQSCIVCQERKGDINKRWTPLHPSAPCDRPWERVAMDLVSLPPSHGYSCVLVVVDYFSKWVEAFPLRTKEASVVAKTLLNEVFFRHGVPSFLHSDRGGEFTAKCLHELTKLCGIYQTHTPAYRPQADGLVERQIGTIKGMLAKFQLQYGDWYGYLGPVLFALRSMVTESTKFSPYEVLYGRKPRLPCDLNYGLPSLPFQDHPSSYRELRARLQNTYAKVKSELATSATRMKERYDAAKKVGIHHFKAGDWVWVSVPPGPRQKMTPRWSGPYIVTSVNSVGSLEIRRHGAFIKVAMDRCKLFHSRPAHLQSPAYAEQLRTATVDFRQDPPALCLGKPGFQKPGGPVPMPRPVTRGSAHVPIHFPVGHAATRRQDFRQPPRQTTLPAPPSGGSGQGVVRRVDVPPSPPLSPAPVPSSPVNFDPAPVDEPRPEPQPVIPSNDPVVVLPRPEDVQARQQPATPPVRPEANSPPPAIPHDQSVPVRRSGRIRGQPFRLEYDGDFNQVAVINTSPVSHDLYFTSCNPLRDIGFVVVNTVRGPKIVDIQPYSVAWLGDIAPMGAIITKVDDLPVYYMHEYYDALHVSNGKETKVSILFEYFFFKYILLYVYLCMLLCWLGRLFFPISSLSCC